MKFIAEFIITCGYVAGFLAAIIVSFTEGNNAVGFLSIGIFFGILLLGHTTEEQSRSN